MKVDVELVREVLLKVEKMPFDGAFHDIVDGRSQNEIAYHVMILHETEFVEAMDLLGGHPKPASRGHLKTGQL